MRHPRRVDGAPGPAIGMNAQPATLLEYRRRPSAIAYMLGAMRPSPGFRKAGGVPPISARWLHRPDRRELASFRQLSGLPESEYLPMLYPHTISFPLQMAILTHPAFPVPIWNVLQIRNQLLQLAPVPVVQPLDLTVSVAGHRILEKGAEIDLHAVASAGGAPAWEAINTFYVRGRFGEPDPITLNSAAPAPAPGEQHVVQWRMPKSGGWRFGGLSGDYNGIHLSGWYARRFGFPCAFLHPQRVLGQCLARLPVLDPATPQRLDTWLKGPVYYGAPVSLQSAGNAGGTGFALYIDGDKRPAILGHLRAVAPGTRLAAGSAATN
jgi:hypothetical protein